ncbi:hypothetical protein C8Q75DRAFT_469756 [Abortiporus biennis]|nr:hypothetical protein C8Q75DRAFT_469756 [Abortiporus biennis]
MSMSALPNPFTPLAWLPPDIASQVQVVNFVLPAISGAWISDYLNSVYEEYIMLRKHRLGFSDFVYVLSRIVCCSFIAITLLFITGSSTNVNCEKLNEAVGWLGSVLLPLNSILFFFRVKAVFHDSPIIKAFFALLWLSTFAGISTPFLVQATRLDSTSLCVDRNVAPSSSAAFIIAAVHDTLVYLAISIQLTKMNLPVTLSNSNSTSRSRWTPRWLQCFISGDGMSQVSKALFMSGQFYYLATIGVNISISIAILIPNTPPFYRAMLTVSDAIFQNAMACRVHRQLKIGRILDAQLQVDSSTIPHHHDHRAPLSDTSIDSNTSIKFAKNGVKSDLVVFSKHQDITVETFQSRDLSSSILDHHQTSLNIQVRHVGEDADCY